MILRAGLLALALIGSGWTAAVAAERPDEAVQWLERMQQAARTQSYSGTFVYQAAGQSETSRITRLIDANGERERLEVLDGSPREVVRTNDDVRCFLPRERTVIIDKQISRAALPIRLPASLASVIENYHVRKGEVGRIAGWTSQQLILEPRDALRFGHQLWAETNSGLLLKAMTLNQRNEAIEQFVFTQIQIGGAIDAAALRSRYAEDTTDWRVHNARPQETGIDAGGWQFGQLPGFVRQTGLTRRLHDDGPMMTHVVFSDGLAAVSVFIEPMAKRGESPATGLFASGAVNVYKRVVDGHLVTVLGEVPPLTLQRLGDSVKPRGR